ncbi:MAG: hypothetical protein AMJ60_00740 [Desulfobacterales bacterium SG8_35]|nr:MAG: hypothetical protein AMJ60_00740 [Desulfobacterales bacterium SG8_35]
MLTKFIITLTVFYFLSVIPFCAAAAEDSSPLCTRLHEKAINGMVKYSLDADVNGPQFFSGIRCALRYRNTELCAIEMVSFDITGKVYDYYTAERIEIGAAYFWLDEKNTDTPILAFSSKESAEKYGAEKKEGIILDYSGLTDRMLK